MDKPWLNEPEHVDFKHAGFDCILHRVGTLGHWCGYVGVPKGHPAHGKHYDDVGVNVHGGLTYADKCQGSVCHKTDGDDDLWWLGFDCAHCGDFSPYTDSVIPYEPIIRGTYRDLAYVKQETQSLAEQLSGPVG